MTRVLPIRGLSKTDYMVRTEISKTGQIGPNNCLLRRDHRKLCQVMLIAPGFVPEGGGLDWSQVPPAGIVMVMVIMIVLLMVMVMVMMRLLESKGII